jgi:hypothetical protein
MNKTDADEPERRFVNHYACPHDGAKWTNEWSCACNDHCSVFNAEIEPEHSIELFRHPDGSWRDRPINALRALPPMTDAQYVAQGGKECPYCRSDDIVAGEHEFGGAYAAQNVTCRSCGRTWVEVFELAGWSAPDRPKPKAATAR